MISTIPTAKEVYENKRNIYKHQDEIWIWTPSTQRASEHLIGFLSAFQNAPEVIHNKLSAEFWGPDSDQLIQIFNRNFLSIPYITLREKKNSLSILHFKAGSINSRKSMITPYLPKLIS